MPRNFKLEELYKKDKHAQVARMILNSQNIVYFTGAGIGTDSGIPDYRGSGSAYWAKFNLMEFSFTEFLANEDCRREYWRMDEEFYELVKKSQPNATHYSLVELEKMGKLNTIITQNVDGLHQKACSSPGKIIEIHGNIFSVSCLHCFKDYSREDIHQLIQRGVSVPYCSFCHGILKSDTIAFGQAIPEHWSAKSLMATLKCNLFVVIGSSLLVQPAAYLVVKAKEAGAKIVIINLMPTPYDTYADVVIYASAKETMLKIIEKIK